MTQKRKADEIEVNISEQAKDRLSESVKGAYDPRHPIYAVIDHLKGIKSSHALNYFASPDKAVAQLVRDYGAEDLRAYLHDNGHDGLIDRKMDDVLMSAGLIAEICDHNSQSYINFQDSLNRLSVAE
jgi:hypothetical protein